MSDNHEWKDANYSYSNLPNKGRLAIQCIVTGIIIGLVLVLGRAVRPLFLASGAFLFVSGISMLIRRRRYNFETALVLTAFGFLMLLAHPRFGVVAAFAGYFLVVGAILLVIFGLINAVKISWEISNKT